MKKTIIFLGLAVVLLSGLAYAQSLPPIPGTLSEKSDQLKKIYSELEAGMTFDAVRNIGEKHHSDLKLKDTDIWGPGPTLPEKGRPLFYWVLGVDAKMIPVMGRSDKVRMHKIVLRLDFDSNLRLINAVYVRYGKWFKNGDSVMEERMVLVGSDNIYRN